MTSKNLPRCTWNLGASLPASFKVNHLLNPFKDCSDQLLDFCLGVVGMEDESDTALALWYDGVVDWECAHLGELQVVEEEEVVALASHYGDDVGDEWPGFPVINERDGDNSLIQCCLPEGVGGDGFKEVSDYVLELVL